MKKKDKRRFRFHISDLKEKLKHKPVKEIKQVPKQEFLKQSHIKHNQIQTIENGRMLVFNDNTKAYVYRFNFIRENGINSEIDRKNNRLLSFLLSEQKYPFKIYIFDEKKELLKNTIRYFEKQKEHCNSVEVLTNRLQIMYRLESMHYNVYYLVIDIRNKDFEVQANDLLYLERLEKIELIQFVRSLNNLV